MKKLTGTAPVFRGLAAVALMLAVVWAQSRIVSRIDDLKTRTAELRLLAERRGARAETLAARIAALREERDRFDKLPIVPADTPEDLKAALEQGALAAQVECAVSLSPDPDRLGAVRLEAALRARGQGIRAFLSELLARREFFCIDRVEARRTGERSFGVDMTLSAFLRKGAAS
ncbi:MULTISPECIES: hypothetical protein [unclassified Pyramidobacter]|uniref:hypothetical protein n=1 Tax=unclassified Pyramidobacter TaxID=2632171 RepID=UPI000EA1AAE9|nr:hypothetical protein [Pyramidobacter sp. CG50-2]RKJ80080.1 hypothetical protein D7D26_03755 [Pyramidobacter sp. CG50-2]